MYTEQKTQSPEAVERAFAEATAEALQRNHRENWAWDYGLPGPHVGELRYVDERAYWMARRRGYEGLCEWVRAILPQAKLT